MLILELIFTLCREMNELEKSTLKNTNRKMNILLAEVHLLRSKLVSHRVEEGSMWANKIIFKKGKERIIKNSPKNI